MWELVKAGGWLMLPILICSVAAAVIIIERAIRLKMGELFPEGLRQQLIGVLRDKGEISRNQLQRVKKESPLGDVLATGLLYRDHGLESMTMHMQNRASVQVHALERNINMLGTIGAIAPLLGLLGTVLGIILSFLSITQGGLKDTEMLAYGVSQALITTAGGMIVAIPALIGYRFFQRRVVDINARLEQEAGLMIQELYDNDLMLPSFKQEYKEGGQGGSFSHTADVTATNTPLKSVTTASESTAVSKRKATTTNALSDESLTDIPTLSDA